MPERDEYRQLLELARKLARTPIDVADSRDELAAVRSQIAGGGARGLRRQSLLIMSGSIAAAAALAIGLAVMALMTPKNADAAEALQAAANATQDYQGWVHVTPVMEGGLVSALKPHVESIHINTADGSVAIVAKVYGTLLIEMDSPAAHERRMYTGLSGRVLISSMRDEVAASAIKRGAEFPLKLADFLRQIKSRGAAAPKVVESADQGLDRFDLTLAGDSTTPRDQIPEMPDGKVTLWVDPQSKLIRKTTARIDEQPAMMEYAYGAPDIRDIYDLGVPKAAEIVDSRENGAAVARPTVFDVPATAQLVKDETIDMKSMEERLQKRIDADWGDFVMLECDEPKSLHGVGHLQGQLILAARQGEKAIYANYLLAPEMALWGGQGFPKGWPEPKLTDVDLLLRSAQASRVEVSDGKTGWHGELSGGRLGSAQVKPTTQPIAGSMVKIGSLLWPSIKSLPPGFGTMKAEVLSDPARPGLIVLRVQRNLPIKLFTSAPNYRSDALYWLDPAHDDLPVETVIHNNSAGGNVDTAMHFVYLDFARFADGRWYPSHWQYRSIRAPATRPVTDDGYVEYWRQILPNERLAPEWYGDPNLRMTDKVPRFPATEPLK